VGGMMGQNQGNHHLPAKRVGIYIGNLTWWTTDQDVTDAISAVGVNDVLDIKFFENRANGQSKGRYERQRFAASGRTVKMADGVDIDLYADDLEQDFNQDNYNDHDQNVDLYDDVIAAPSSDGNSDE
ncbi:hypothetical protein ISCGN_025714, partial [Ixodes scapularis]